MDYKVREVELGDVFLANKIFKKIDLRAMVKEIGFEDAFDKDQKEKASMTYEKGIDVALYLFGKLDEAEKEILTLLGAWTGVPIDQVKKITITDLETIVPQFLELNKAEKLRSFFGRAAQAAMDKKK